MSNVESLISRLKAEFSAHDQKQTQARSAQVQEHKDRQKRLGQLESVFDQLRDVWRPRLEALASQFKDQVKLEPSVVPGRRRATFTFQSPLAHIALQFAASTDADVENLVLTYDLDILPIFTTFEKHSEIEFPIDRIDKEAMGKWLDDRIVDFVKVYLSLYENEFYLKDHMVEDPVARVKFPKFVAAATVQRKGQTYYFISDETRREFESKG